MLTYCELLFRGSDTFGVVDCNRKMEQNFETKLSFSGLEKTFLWREGDVLTNSYKFSKDSLSIPLFKKSFFYFDL